MKVIGVLKSIFWELASKSDKLYLRLKYKRITGKWLHLRYPKTFNEKLQWLKLFYRDSLYTTLVDKYAVKEYVANSIGKEYVIPLLGKWDSVEDIDWNSLPNQFVIKTNHDSGGVLVCTDKTSFDTKYASDFLKDALKKNTYNITREWPYKSIVPCVIAEEYKCDRFSELRDYKFFCFNGEPKVMFIASNRHNEKEETAFDFFDMEGNHLNITNGHPNAAITPSLPVSFGKMRELSRVLSKNIPHVRVDFYEVDDSPLFGEMTFFHWGGFMPFCPVSWDYTFGKWLVLPANNVRKFFRSSQISKH